MDTEEKKVLLQKLTDRLRKLQAEQDHKRHELVIVKEADANDAATHEAEVQWAIMEMDRSAAAMNRIELAVNRIRSGTFDGCCGECGEPISAERLAVEPCASTCVDCKKLKEEKDTRQFNGYASGLHQVA